MSLLFFDTETTGLPKDYKAPASALANWPRMIQIAWLLTDNSGNEIKGAEYIIKPSGFTIPESASRIHGITTDIANRKGAELFSVLNIFIEDLRYATTLIAHNISFDEKIVGAEFLRNGLTNHIESKPRKCTMTSSTQYCAIPGNYGYKWPKLEELYSKLFGSNFVGAHNALADVQACAKCYFKLRQIGIM